MKLHHVKCQKTTIFVADHCETTRTCDIFPGRVYGLFTELFLHSPEYRYCGTPSPPLRIDSEQANFDEMPLVKTNLSLYLGCTT
jgi:hypothetical protein